MHSFDISNDFSDILKKTVFEKSLSGARGRKNVLTWVKTRLKYLSYLGIESLPWAAQSRYYFPKIRGGGVFYVFLDPHISKNGSRYQNVSGT